MTNSTNKLKKLIKMTLSFYTNLLKELTIKVGEATITSNKRSEPLNLLGAQMNLLGTTNIIVNPD